MNKQTIERLLQIECLVLFPCHNLKIEITEYLYSRETLFFFFRNFPHVTQCWALCLVVSKY